MREGGRGSWEGRRLGGRRELSLRYIHMRILSCLPCSALRQLLFHNSEANCTALTISLKPTPHSLPRPSFTCTPALSALSSQSPLGSIINLPTPFQTPLTPALPPFTFSRARSSLPRLFSYFLKPLTPFKAPTLVVVPIMCGI